MVLSHLVEVSPQSLQAPFQLRTNRIFLIVLMVNIVFTDFLRVVKKGIVVMEFLIIWMIFGGICWYLADKNGRNVPLAVFLGVFFGIFAVIGYAIAGSASKCPSCAESVKPEATVCKHCKTAL
jgi:hypothetical protein